MSISSKPHLFMSCLMLYGLSIHLLLGLPFARVPLTSIFIVCFTLFSSSIRKMVRTSSTSLSMSCFHSQISHNFDAPLSVTLLIRLNILISVALPRSSPLSFIVPIILDVKLNLYSTNELGNVAMTTLLRRTQRRSCG